MITNYKGEIESPRRMLTVSEVAYLLHVHPNTVRVWSDKGLLRTYRLGFRQDRRYSLADVKSFLLANGN